MKKILFLLWIPVLSATAANAQITKGSIWLGGNLGFGSSKNDFGENSKSNSYSISPAIGVAIKNNTVVGIEFAFIHSLSESKYDTMRMTSNGVGIFDRKYWMIVKRLYILADVNANYTSMRQDERYSSGYNNFHGWSVGVSASPGIAFSVCKWFYLESEFNRLFYFNYTSKVHYESDQTGTSAYTSNSITGGTDFGGQSPFLVGFRFIISK